MLLVLTSPAENNRGPQYCEQAFANLGRYPFTLLVVPIDGAVTLALQCSDQHRQPIARELQARYPDMRITKHPEPVLPEGRKRFHRWLTLKPSWFQMRTYSDFGSSAEMADPIASLLATIAPDKNREVRVEIAFECRPLSLLRRIWLARMCQVRGDPAKAQHQLYGCRVRISVAADRNRAKRAKERIHEVAAVFGQYTSGTPAAWLTCRRPKSFALNDCELATLWHPALVSVRAPTMQSNDSRELEAPLLIGSEREQGSALLGTHVFRKQRQNVFVKRNDRRRFLSLFGKTGMGKSTLLQQMIVSDMQAGHGTAIIDPHGDLAAAVLRSVPRRRTNDVVYFDASDRDFPPAYEPLHGGKGLDTSLTASGVVSAFKKLYGDSWGPRLEHILRFAVLALLEVEGTSLVSLMRLLSDKRYRETIVGQVSDPVVRAFWLDEFAHKPPKWIEEAIAPIQNKVGQFLASPLLRSIVGQVPGRIDVREIMDNEKILIVNLSKGNCGEDACTLLGALLVTGIQQAAMSRSDIPEEERKEFFLYVDEFASFQTEAFATAFSELRKYRLSLVTANQFIAQLEPGIRDALLGNVGSMLCFQLGIEDAELLAPQLGGDIKPLDLISLPKYHAYARLLVDGMPSKPFSMQTIPPAKLKGEDRSEKIRRTSRRQYARSIAEVTRQIEKQMG